MFICIARSIQNYECNSVVNYGSRKAGLNEKKVVKLVARPMSLSTDSISRIADGGNKQAVFIL